MVDENIVILPVITKLDIPAARVLEQALKRAEDLESVVVVGFYENGEMYFSSSVGDAAQVIWHFQRAERRLHQIVDGDS